MKLSDAIEQRRSVRKFSSKKIRWDKVLEAIDAAVKAPFAGNINNLQFLIVTDQELKNKLAECCQQDFIADAAFVIVVCADYKELKRMYQDRCDTYAKQHAGAAIENFLLKITDLKLSSCWIGSFTEEQIKDALLIPKDITIEALLPVGQEAPHSRQKSSRKAGLQNVIHWDKWNVRKKPKLFKDPKTW
jgi:nitroreductase